MKNILLLVLSTISFSLIAQPWSSNGVCDLVDGTQWNNGGAKGCACTWYSVENGDTILNCAFGDCGQSDLLECVYDCNGHNGNTTDMIQRECDATATPFCWYNGGGGDAGEQYCLGIVLPVELINFSGYAHPNYNEINWTTLSEIDNDYFIISYSNNGMTFEELIRVGGAGTTTQEQNYTFRHTSPINGVNYYKLEQIDYNGESKEYPIISINNNTLMSSNLFTEIYPNPSSDIFYFNYNGKILSQSIYVTLCDTKGNVILRGEVNKFNNSQAIPFKLINVMKGYYFLKITQGDYSEVKSLMVK